MGTGAKETNLPLPVPTILFTLSSCLPHHQHLLNTSPNLKVTYHHGSRPLNHSAHLLSPARFFHRLAYGTAVMFHRRSSPSSIPTATEGDASFLSRLYFQWMHPLICFGSRVPLQHQHLPPLRPNDTAKATRPLFHSTYRAVAAADFHRSNFTTPFSPPWHPSWLLRLALFIPPSIASKTYRAFIPVVFYPFALAAASKPIWLATAVGQAFTIRTLISYVMRASSNDPLLPSRWSFLPVVLALPIAAHLMSLSHHATFTRSMSAGMRARAAVTAEIFHKALCLSPDALARTSEGEMGNLLLNDSQRILDSFTYFHFCWIGFIEISVMTALLSIDLGFAAFFALLMLIMLVPAQIGFAVFVKRARGHTTAKVDVRVQKMTEILSGIRTVKLSAWEPHFMSVVADLRMREVQSLKNAAILRALNSATFFAAPVMVSLAIFSARTLIFQKPLSPSVVFSSLSLLWSISITLNFIPLGYLAASEASVSSRRLDDFFDLPELPSTPLDDRLDIVNIPPEGELDPCDSSGGCDMIDPGDIDEIASSEELYVRGAKSPRLWARRAQFCYAQPGKNTTGALNTVLTDVSFSASDGELVSIVGPVGSGKSSLLLGLLGEILCPSGEVRMKGRIAYCAQQPWIVNGTLRDNVTMFGADNESFDHEWYQTVVGACCLLPDIQLLPTGDLTEIGERGVNLSGGQKARVSLARAVFSRADIYLLDDPLSAVDVVVSGRLIRTIFGSHGLLAGKVQLVVTHQLNFLPVSSKVVVLGGRKIRHCGTFAELCARGVEFAGFSGLEEDIDLEHSDTAKEIGGSQEEDSIDQNKKFRPSRTMGDTDVDICISKLKSASDKELRRSDLKEVPRDLTDDLNCVKLDADINGNLLCDFEEEMDVSDSHLKGGLVAKEDRQIGTVTANVYKSYIKAGGGYTALCIVCVSFMAAQAIRTASEWWLARWSNAVERVSPDELLNENRFQALVFFGFTAGAMIFTLLRAAAFAGRTMCASRKLHNDLLERVLHAKPSFFDTNPVGRILNRFSKDIDQMDSMLPVAAQDFLQIFFVALGALISISIILPWFMLPLIPIVLSFLVLQRMYKKSSRELKRLEAVSRSPIYAQFVESANGLATIRAYRMEERFSSLFNAQIDENHCAYHMFACAGRWLGIRLDGLAAMVSFCTSLVVLILSPRLNPGLAGVALTQSIALTGIFQWGVRQAAETENLFTSVERVTEMAMHTPIERPYDIAAKKPQPDWPSKGCISFNCATLKYRPELDPALKNVSFQTSSCERIGIVGRTGSGKSSLLVSLFRMVELAEGSIVIDGIDISEIGLHDLRCRMAIVPQDPVLFNGTIRSNLDPTGSSSDVQLWDAIHRVHMKHVIEGIGGGLDGEGLGLDLVVQGKGSNFSAGERQLIALARAILSGVKIVVLDEASASLDNHTDMLVQKTVREQLSDRTVLTVAHRLATIADSDRVLVMDGGEIVEFDKPSELIVRGGYFAQLVQESGLRESAILKGIIGSTGVS